VIVWFGEGRQMGRVVELPHRNEVSTVLVDLP
jgi:hypothetical protein